MKYVLMALLTIACASRPAKDPVPGKAGAQSKSVSMESKQLANEQESNLVTEISFSKEKVGLPKGAKERIRDLFARAKGKGKIEEIKVITWADQEYPSVHEKELSEKQKRLAERRNESIEKYIDQISKGTDVETISMAERPSALSSLFSSPDARIKKSLETAGIPNTDTTVKVPGMASKSIVIFIMEEG